MQIISGSNLEKLVDYSFGDHHAVWDKRLTGSFKPANISNAEFLMKCEEIKDRPITLFIDNIRLYPRSLEFSGENAEKDANFIKYLMTYNDLLGLCAQLPLNKFIIFCSQEDTPIDDTIKLPDNVLKIYAVNALYNNDRIIPFPFGLQRQIGTNDNRLAIMKQRVEEDKRVEPTKLLYINCGVERHPERLPLAKFEHYSFATTRFDKDSKFYPYDQYNAFLDELQDHKFVACPKGHGYDTHRIWETLYMRRVPVMIRDPYFERLLKDFPVLFINSWEEISEPLLNVQDWLFKEAQAMDLSKLDLDLLYEQSKS